jgi:hypothetical protein
MFHDIIGNQFGRSFYIDFLGYLKATQNEFKLKSGNFITFKNN